MIDETQAYIRTQSQKKRKEGTLVYKDLLEAHEFFGEKCPYSETPINENNWHLEHIIPVKMGGTTDPWNCIPVCGPCNLSKSSDHLLDWWDKTHKPEEEYRLEKLFIYLIKQLNKERTIKITTQEEKEKLKRLEILENSEEQIDEDYIDTTKELDIFTFMYQLLNHIIDSKTISTDKINYYTKILEDCIKQNNQYNKLDIELYKLQNEFTKYLKQIGVTKHYVISFEYSSKIENLEEGTE